MRIANSARAQRDNQADSETTGGGRHRRAVQDAAAVPVWPGRELLDDPELARILYSVWSGDPATVVPSPPGAGKTRLVVLLAASLAARAGLRVAVAAQTRQQAVQIAQRLGSLEGVAGKLLWKKGTHHPDLGVVDAVGGGAARWPRRGGGVVIATTARWLYANPDHLGADVMIIDEAWQATCADAGALGAFARQVVCVGDPGQIAPVVTAPTDKWGSGIGPHSPAPEAILAAHGEHVGVVKLRYTWRLGAATTGLIAPLYPDLRFTSRRPPEYLSVAGQAVPEVAHAMVAAAHGPCDDALVAAAADRVRELLGTEYVTGSGARAVSGENIAVVTGHVNQAAAVAAQLADVPGVLVGTANALQGLERPASVVLHPMVGYRSAEAFSLDQGRLCVMLSRHRAHLTMICDSATSSLLDPADPGHGIAADMLTAVTSTPRI